MFKRILFVLAAAAVCLPNGGFAQQTMHKLQGVEVLLHDTLENDPFPGLDSTVANYKVFFTGEDHTFTSSNILLELKMMRFLHKKARMRVHLLEFGASVGWLVNNYVQTGDTSYLTALKDYSYKDFRALFTGLRDFNARQDSASRIRVVGLDLEWSFSTSCKVLSLLLNDSVTPASEIALSVETIRGLAEYVTTNYNGRTAYGGGGFGSLYSGNFDIENAMMSVMENYYSNRDAFQKCIKKEPETFEKIMNGIREWKKWKEYEEKQMIQGTYFREQYMYDRFMEVYKNNPGVSFYGQFGRCHVARNVQSQWCNSYMFNAVAGRMNTSTDTTLRNKVFTIAVYYPNAHRTSSGKFLFGFEPTPEEQEISRYLDSDRRTGLFLYEVSADTALKRIMTDKFQYLLLNFSPHDDDSERNNTGKYKPYEHSKTYYHADGFITFHYMNTSSLFTFLSESGFIADNNRISQAGGGLTICENGYQAAQMHYTYFLPVAFRDTAGTSGKVSGYQFMFRTGREVGPRNWFQAFPYLGIGFGNMKLHFSDENAPNGIFGSPNKENYRNNAFLMDVGADVRTNIGFVSLGIRGGFMLDTSDKVWKSGDDVIANAPRTGMTGLYYSFNVSLFLSE
ncbi:MAG: erythromycin esterase family protein [Bacteroidia bacterium]|nr:erythromycin esterase family protein [Bacteroidia bacterium]